MKKIEVTMQEIYDTSVRGTTPTQTKEPPKNIPLTKDLAQTIFDTFPIDTQREWKSTNLTKEMVFDKFTQADPQFEYPDGSDNWYNQKEIYDLIIDNKINY